MTLLRKAILWRDLAFIEDQFCSLRANLEVLLLNFPVRPVFPVVQFPRYFRNISIVPTNSARNGATTAIGAFVCGWKNRKRNA